MSSGYVDTHCNIPNILTKLELKTFAELREKYITPVNGEEFQGCLSVSSDTESREATYQLVTSEALSWGCMGIHPLYSVQYTQEAEKDILRMMPHQKVVAWGEIGLDYHDFGPGYDYAKPDLQKSVFITQLKHALSLKKAIVIHTREAEAETMKIMKEHIPSDWKVHVHCFTDSAGFAKDLVREWKNLYIGFTGVITFKNSTDIQNAVKEVPMDRLLLETDGPFMAPVPHRGKPCHPGHIPYIAKKIAELKGLPIEEVYHQTRANTRNMFGF